MTNFQTVSYLFWRTIELALLGLALYFGLYKGDYSHGCYNLILGIWLGYDLDKKEKVRRSEDW